MRPRLVAFFFLFAGLPSCALISAPFTVAGKVVEGTYNVGEKIVTAPIDAYDRRQAKKDAEKEKQDKDAEKKKSQQPQQGLPPSGNIMDSQPLPQSTPLPPANEPLPPLQPPQ